MNNFRAIIITAFTAIILVLQGCSSFSGAKTDIDPLATETSEFIEQVEFGLQTEQSALLVRYMNRGQIPEADAFGAQWDELMLGLSEIGEYSINLIEIAEEKEDPAAKDALADNLAALYTGLRALPSVAPELADVDLDTILLEVRSAEKFIDSARAVHKAIDPAVEALDALTTSAGENLDVTYDRLLVSIDDYHAESLGYRTVVDENRDHVFSLLELLNVAYFDNDKDTWDTLRESDRELQAVLKGIDSPTVAAVNKAQGILIGQLAVLDGLRVSLQPDMQLYKDELVELRTVAQSSDAALKVARVTVDAWDQGHRNFVEGHKTGFAAVTSFVTAYAIEKGRRKIF
jgi:hypothetical protein